METIFGDKKIIFNAGVEGTVEYLNSDTVTTRVPRVKLLVSPFGLPFVPLELIGSDLGGVIQQAQWVKSRSVPGGTLQLVLAGDTGAIERIIGIDQAMNFLEKISGEFGPDFKDIFKPMALCQFWVNGYHMMTGYVKSCKRKSKPNDKSAEVSYTVIINELGTLYQKDILSFQTIQWGVDKNYFDAYDIAKNLASVIIGLPLDKALMMLDLAFSATSLSAGFTLSDGFPLAYRMIAAPPPLGAIATLSIVSQMACDSGMFQLAGGGSFWDYIKALIPSPFMELTCESGGRTMVTQNGLPTVMFPGFNYLVARTTPYDNPMLGFPPLPHAATLLPFSLGVVQLLAGGDFIIITDDDVLDKNLGVDEEQQFTAFRVSYGGKKGSNASKDFNKPSYATGPINPLASGGLKSFGGREYNTDINPVSLEYQGATSQFMEEFFSKFGGIGTPSALGLSTLLNVWMRNASKFNEGSIKTRAIPYARPGMYMLYLPSQNGIRVDNPRDIGIYYIDNLSYDYGIGQGDTTTFSVIRGIPIPQSIASTVLQLLDWEILPPATNLYDGETRARMIK